MKTGTLDEASLLARKFLVCKDDWSDVDYIDEILFNPKDDTSINQKQWEALQYKFIIEDEKGSMTSAALDPIVSSDAKGNVFVHIAYEYVSSNVDEFFGTHLLNREELKGLVFYSSLYSPKRYHKNDGEQMKANWKQTIAAQAYSSGKAKRDEIDDEGDEIDDEAKSKELAAKITITDEFYSDSQNTIYTPIEGIKQPPPNLRKWIKTHEPKSQSSSQPS